MRIYIRHIIVLMIALFCLFGFAYCETEAPEFIFDNGGGYVLADEPMMLSMDDDPDALVLPNALTEEIRVAYMECSDVYITPGKETTWTVHAEGGDGQFRYTFYLYYKDPTNDSSTKSEYTLEYTRARSTSNSFSYCTQKSGRYIILTRIYPVANGTDTSDVLYVDWQSPAYQTAEDSDYDDVTTVPGKVAEIAELCIKSCGDNQYEQALWLHDWIINHASYDNSYSYYYADGVLLNGTGVCNSYSLAYELLLNAVGIENRYVIGYTDRNDPRGSGHSWNMLYLEGDWYQVDCTWDDNTSTGETHTYFMVSDAVLSKNHYWETVTKNNSSGTGLIGTAFSYTEDCDSLALNYYVQNGAVEVCSEEEAENAVNDAVRMKQEYLVLISTGTSLYRWTYNALLTCRDEYSDYSTYRPVSWLLFLHFDYTGEGTNGCRLSSLKADCRKTALSVGETIYPSVSYAPERVYTENGWRIAELSWTSDAPGVVHVDGDGKLTAVAPGVATITVSCGLSSVHFSVRVGGYNFTVPASLEKVGDRAFYDCDGIESVLIPNGICSSIGSKAFANCSGLRLVSIPDSVKSIASDAFAGSGRVVIVCGKDSYARTFAASNGIEYQLID